MPSQLQHENRCLARLGAPWPEVHRALDRFIFLWPGSVVHRVILHHRLGIDAICRELGEAARLAARLHVLDDMGRIPHDPADVAKMYAHTVAELHYPDVVPHLIKFYGQCFGLDEY